MSSVQSTLEQIAGILVRDDLKFTTANDGASYRLLFTSGAVFIGVRGWQQGVRVVLSSPVVSQVDRGGPGGAHVLNVAAELNASHAFLKFLVDEDGDLMAVHELLGDEMAACELVNAIRVMAAATEALGETLADELDGATYMTLLDQASESSTPTHDLEDE